MSTLGTSFSLVALTLLAGVCPAQAGNDRPVDLTDMVLIPAGEVTLGNDQGNAASKPRHKVYLDAFYIDKFEVTNEKFARFLNEHGRMKAERGFVFDPDGKMICRPDFIRLENGQWRPAPGRGRFPVVSVTWHGADTYARFCGKRLPTDAEWEKAARGGTDTPWFFGDDPSLLDDYAWHYGNSPHETHEVGLKKPNPFGLYDVYGNVYEVVSDWYSDSYYAKSSDRNPKGPETGRYHIRRGGSYYYSAMAGCNSWQRVTTQIGAEPEETIVDSNWGFRVAADVPQAGMDQARKKE